MVIKEWANLTKLLIKFKHYQIMYLKSVTLKWNKN